MSESNRFPATAAAATTSIYDLGLGSGRRVEFCGFCAKHSTPFREAQPLAARRPQYPPFGFANGPSTRVEFCAEHRDPGLSPTKTRSVWTDTRVVAIFLAACIVGCAVYSFVSTPRELR